jgi:hypothetical protein
MLLNCRYKSTVLMVIMLDMYMQLHLNGITFLLLQCYLISIFFAV